MIDIRDTTTGAQLRTLVAERLHADYEDVGKIAFTLDDQTIENNRTLVSQGVVSGSTLVCKPAYTVFSLTQVLPAKVDRGTSNRLRF